MNKTRVMVVSQNTKDSIFFKELLEGMNCYVEFFSNPFKAVINFSKQKKRNNPFQVVFTDYLLPKMNGIELGILLKKMETNLSMMMIPNDFLFEPDVKKAYHDFGGFTHPPDTSYKGIKEIISRV